MSCWCKVIGHWLGYIAKRETILHTLFQLEGIVTLIICDIAIDFMLDHFLMIIHTLIMVSIIRIEDFSCPLTFFVQHFLCADIHAKKGQYVNYWLVWQPVITPTLPKTIQRIVVI